MLIAQNGPVAGRRLAEAWQDRFPEHYKGYTTVASAAYDIACFARLSEGEHHVVGIQALDEFTRVCLYKRGEKVLLSQAMPMLEDLGLKVSEELSTRLSGEEDEVWVQEFRVLGPVGRAARRRVARRGGRGGDRGRLARRRGERLAEPARRDRRPGPPPARGAAGVPQVPPAGRLALHRGLPERGAGGQLRGDREARALLRGPLRPVARARRGRRARAARGDPRRPRGRRLARPRPDPAQPALADRRDAADVGVPRGRARRWRSSCARPTCRRCRSPPRSTRSTSTGPGWRASTCAAGGSRAAASAGATGWTTAPRSTG